MREGTEAARAAEEEAHRAAQILNTKCQQLDPNPQDVAAE